MAEYVELRTECRCARRCGNGRLLLCGRIRRQRLLERGEGGPLELRAVLSRDAGSLHTSDASLMSASKAPWPVGRSCFVARTRARWRAEPAGPCGGARRAEQAELMPAAVARAGATDSQPQTRRWGSHGKAGHGCGGSSLEESGRHVLQHQEEQRGGKERVELRPIARTDPPTKTRNNKAYHQRRIIIHNKKERPT